MFFLVRLCPCSSVANSFIFYSSLVTCHSSLFFKPPSVYEHPRLFFETVSRVLLVPCSSISDVSWFFEFCSAFADGVEEIVHIFDQYFFTVDASDSRCCAAFGYFGLFVLCGEGFMERENRAIGRDTGVGTAFAAFVGFHRAHFFVDQLRIVGQVDGVVIRLAHFATVQTRKFGDRG